MPDEPNSTQADAPSPEPSLSDALSEFIDEVDMNPDTGELEIRMRDDEPEEDSDSDGSEDSEDTSDSADEDTAQEPVSADPSPDAASDTWEGRYRELRSHKDQQLTEAYKLLQEAREQMSRLEGMQEASRGTQEEPSTEDNFDLNDPDLTPQRLQTFINTQVQAGVEKALGNLNIPAVQDLLEDREMLHELEAVRHEYPDFDQYIPQIQTVLNQFKESDMTYDQAYQIVKLFGSPGAAAPAPQQETRQVGSADTGDDQLQRRIEKQRRLQRPVSATTDDPFNQEPEVGSIKDAIRAGMEEVLSPGS
jgi:hypothetical protein